jgi:hypothetical protein
MYTTKNGSAPPPPGESVHFVIFKQGSMQQDLPLKLFSDKCRPIKFEWKEEIFTGSPPALLNKGLLGY